MRIATFFLLLAPLGLPACSRPTEAVNRPTSRPAATAPAYVDPTYGFSIAAPRLATSGKDRHIAVAFEGPARNGFAPNVTVLVEPIHTTRKDYLTTSLATLTQANAHINSSTELTVSGHEAEMLDYDLTTGPRHLRYLQLLVVTDDLVYIVTCTALADSFAQCQDSFQQTLQSFRPPR